MCGFPFLLREKVCFFALFALFYEKCNHGTRFTTGGEELDGMSAEQIRKQYHALGGALTGRCRVLILLIFTVCCHAGHILLFPFPKRDALTYLHVLHYWNTTGSFTQMLEKFPKFGLLLFTFLPLKWADQAGIPLWPASIVWMVILSTVAVYAFYKIVLLLTGDIAKAMWCGALLAVHPMLMLNAGSLLRDTPYLMFLLLHVLCLLYVFRSKRWYFMVLAGVTLAMCLLSRFESWELLLLSPLFVLFYAKQEHFGAKRTLAFALLAAAGLIGTVLLMLAAVDDLPLLYAKGRVMVLSFLPKWMEV